MSVNLVNSNNIEVNQNGDNISLDFASGGQVEENTTNIGDLSNLNTTEQGSLVGAINEVNNNLQVGALKLYNLWTGSSTTGTFTLADDIDNYVALIFIVGIVGTTTSGTLNSHIVVPWGEQIDSSGNFSGWRTGSSAPDIQFTEKNYEVVGYVASSTSIVISTNGSGKQIRVIYGLKYE